MDLLGKTLGNYRIDRLLGEGGMGAVYQAYDLALQRQVAIKLIHPHLVRQPKFAERFIQEVRLMAHLDHPGIVRVYTFGKERDLSFLVMEFIRGGNLRQLLDRLIQERKWLPLNESVLLVQQLCQVVEYAHKHGVLHRDIKPANLMLKPEPTAGLPFRVVLTDLGLAKLLEGLGITGEGTSPGTPAYMSPEQASGQATNPRSDVYSLGVLLYELAVGRLPFPIRTITEATRYHTQEALPLPRSIRPELPEDLERVILKALEKEPEDRYDSAAALGAVLSGSRGPEIEINDSADLGTVSLLTEYHASIIASSSVTDVSLMTVLENDPVDPHGWSVFADRSVPPSPETRIQVVPKEQTPKVFTLPPHTVTIGRGKDNYIVLEDDKASRRHAQITWDGLEYHVMDLNSSNGTYLENVRLLPGISEVFKPNQSLRIGDTWLRLVQGTRKSSNADAIRTSIHSSSHLASSSAGVVGVSVTPQQLTVEAGETATATLSVLNQSQIVDHFSLSLTGIPNSWIASLPPNIPLIPGEQKETTFSILVPRAPQSRAGRHLTTLRITSQHDPSQFVEVKLNLTITAYPQFKTELRPRRLQAGQMTRLTITNQGNLQEMFTVACTDYADELTFEPSQLHMTVPEGESSTAVFHVRLRQPRWTGGERRHPFDIQVTSSSGRHQTLHAEFLSHGLIGLSRRLDVSSEEIQIGSDVNFRLSIAHPRLLSKQLTSSFLVQIYKPEVRYRAVDAMKAKFDVQPAPEKYTEHTYDSNLTDEQTEQILKIKLFSPQIVFSDPVNKQIDNNIVAVNFVGKPNDNCNPGWHSVMLSISDEKSNLEYQSVSFQVWVTDYVFDHVSRPFLSRIITIILGISSFVMFLLTFLGQIDMTFGLASGTASTLLVSAVHMRFLWLYQKPTTTNYP